MKSFTSSGLLSVLAIPLLVGRLQLGQSNAFATLDLNNICQLRPVMIIETDALSTMVVSPDDTLLATGHYGLNDNIMLWDIATGQSIASLRVPYTGGVNLLFSPNGQTLISASRSDPVLVSNMRDYALSNTVTSGDDVYALLFNLNGSRLFIAGWGDNELRAWNTQSYNEPLSLRTGRQIENMALSSDGALIAISEESSRPSQSGGHVLLVDSVNGLTLEDVLTFRGEILDLTFSSDDHMLAIGGTRSPAIAIYNLNTETLTTFDNHDTFIYAVDFNATNEILAVGGGYPGISSNDYGIRLWDIERHIELCSLLDHHDVVFEIHFTANGKFMLSGSFDNTIIVWGVPQ